jgi:hypothetical protein
LGGGSSHSSHTEGPKHSERGKIFLPGKKRGPWEGMEGAVSWHRGKEAGKWILWSLKSWAHP